VPDEILGQAIKVFVVPLPGVAITNKDVMKYCSSNLEGFMMPKFVQVLDQLPKTPHGKIDKKALR
jgi:acyl-coenzyme A synthetase/AMP-(fatty) acid ligase